MIIDSPIISGSYLSTGSLSQTGNVSITGSLTVTAGISGSFSGSGADLFGIPASGITGLNLSQISSGSVSASISPSQGLLINTSVSASNFTGSFTGSLTGIATSASYASFALTSSYSLGGSGFPFSGSAVITGSLLVSGSAEITGSLSVSGSISASLFGTASQATSASYALTASYLLGYISPFPFTGSAEITGSLIVTGSVAISTLVTSSGVRYVIADQNGLLSAQTASAAIFTTQQVVSTAGQTTFPITNGYATGYVTVFVNGTKLSADEYVDTSGTNIVFLTGSTAGDNVEFQKYLPAAGVSNNTLRSTNYFTATTGQTNFSVNYTPGLLDIFYNGAKLDNTEYTAANGTSITLATASAAGDRLEVDVYSYQVGAFSGIGGTGAANQLAYFNTSNSITGSNAFTVSGSAVIITGSLIVSGSGTLINIGPTVFSGSVTSTAGFSGSFSGNADSASLAQNSLLLGGTGSLAFATTSSFATASGSISTRVTQIENVYATTGSNSFRANQSITGSLVVSSTITAQTLVVQTVTSSIVYSSGSNVFGNSLSNTQTFTGSVNITGSIALAGRLLIGATDDLTNALQVKGDGVFANRTNSAVTSTSILSISTGGTYGTTAAPKYLDLVFSGDNKQIAKIRSVDETGNIDGGYLMFYTSTAAGTVNQNMILHRGGNLNIGTSGTTDAGYKLDVNGTGRFSGALTVSGNLNLQGAVTRNINFYDSSNTNINAQIQYDQISSTSGQLFFGTNNAGTFATRLTIANTGAATFSATSAVGLTVNGGNASDGTVAKFARGGAEKNFYISSTNNQYVNLGTEGDFRFKTGVTVDQPYATGVDAMIIKSTGNVGIGITNPDANLVIGNLNTPGKGSINGASGTINRAIVNCPYPGASALTLAYYSSAYGLDIWVNGDGTGLAPVYFDQRNAEAIIFRRNTQGTAAESMRITSAGNLIVGNAGYQSVTTDLSITGDKVNSNGYYSRLIFQNSNQSGGSSASIRGERALSNYATELTFYTNINTSAGEGSERMRIRYDGNVGIGTTNPAKPLSVWPSGGIGVYSNNTYSPSISLDFNSGTNIGHLLADQNAYYIRTLTSYPIYVQANQANGVYLSVGATSWTANSDERLKNITSNIENAIDSLLTLRAIKHTWKSDNTNKQHLALIAQDVEKVFPEVIDSLKLPSKVGEEQTDETEYLGVRYTELIPVLVKAIQEQNVLIQELQEKLQRNNIN